MTSQPTPSRRLFLAAGPASAVFGALSQAVARAPGEDDPIIQALAEVDRAHAAYEQGSDVSSDEAYERICDAEAELFSTRPTTRAGATRLLRYIADFLDQDDVINDSLVGATIGDSIRDAIAVFERQALAG
ncbi:hypothetical protein ACNHKD_08410 [Methylocystis sp. JAN1]|uniref:hypothetical protein n=1 Tax=Methylocystis sp. JAN1 TaxID=3397211 RepID=UPI003FA27687